MSLVGFVRFKLKLRQWRINIFVIKTENAQYCIGNTGCNDVGGNNVSDFSMYAPEKITKIFVKKEMDWNWNKESGIYCKWEQQSMKPTVGAWDSKIST